MKPTLTILLFLVCMTGMGQVLSIGRITNTHQWVQHECIICGLSIFQCEKMPEHTSYYDNMNWNGGGWQNGCNWDVPSDIVNKAYYVIGDGFVCAACLDKYITPLQEKAEVRYIVALKEAQAENLSNRIKNDNLRKDKEVQKLKDKIQELQDEIDVKNGRKKPTTRHFIDSAKWLYHSDSTTLYLKGSLKWGTITVDTTTSLKLSK